MVGVKKLKEEIDELKDCLRDKNIRLRKIEERYNSIKWVILVIFILAGCVLIALGFHVLGQNLPVSFIEDAEGKITGVNNFNLGALLWVFLFLSEIGFLTIVYIIYKFFDLELYL